MTRPLRDGLPPRIAVERELEAQALLQVVATGPHSESDESDDSENV